MKSRLENCENLLSPVEFKNPGSAYRGAPFWAWNTKLEGKVLKEQLPVFAEMGFGGYHLHSRTGLDTPYLGTEFMKMVEMCAAYAKENGMKCCCYDEDRFPSGAAGGLVTADVRNRQRQLVWTTENVESLEERTASKRACGDYYLGTYAILQRPDGRIASYKRLKKQESPEEGAQVRYAWVSIAKPEPWFNNQTYVDTMYKPAIDAFIAKTHAHYFDKVGAYFGETIPSFFTDEPKVYYKKTLKDPWDGSEVRMPWTDDFPETFLQKYGFDILDALPELFLEGPMEGPSAARYFYHRHILERFCEAYSENIGAWCDAHQVALTGHMVKENKLSSQATSAGEVMAPLSSFGIPGIDMLCDAREYTTAKQTQSVKDQYGRKQMLSELYGVTNWNFDFRGHKLAGDWQAALGVNFRVPHLAWMSMRGESKRDYPASIFYQSPWYGKYHLIEDHFARVNMAMSRGKRQVKIGVIHPVETSWLHWGADSEKKSVLKAMDTAFKSVTATLLFAQLDFDFISEALLPKQFSGISENRTLQVGEMAYQVIVVPSCEALRQSTKQILDQFLARGGSVILLGKTPSFSDGKPFAPEAFASYAFAEDEPALLALLAEYRDFEIRQPDGSLSGQFLVQHRKEEGQEWFFIANGRRAVSDEAAYPVEIRICAERIPYRYDTLTGRIFPVEYSKEKGICIRMTLRQHDSLLLCLRDEALPDAMLCRPEEVKAEPAEAAAVPERVPVTLSEDNCLLLDQCTYQLDEGPVQEKEEILRIGERLGELLQLPQDGGRCAQPWTMEKEACSHRVILYFPVRSRMPLSGAFLALEEAKSAEIRLNGVPVPVKTDGYYTDRAIEKVPLPPLQAGENLLEVTLPCGKDHLPEACYLLGSFGVFRDEGGFVLDQAPETLAFGDIVGQGLPFYGGNITYHLPYTAERKEDVLVKADTYRGSLISVTLDGAPAGEIIFDPYTLRLRSVRSGPHDIALTLYGNRVNTFGPLHNAMQPLKWVGPEAFRPTAYFTYDYMWKETGILKKPELKRFLNKQEKEENNEQ